MPAATGSAGVAGMQMTLVDDLDEVTRKCGRNELLDLLRGWAAHRALP